MTGFVELPGLDDTKEQEPVPEGEYDLRVIRFEPSTSKKGAPMFVAQIRIEEQDAPLIYDYMMLPEPDGEYNDMRLRGIARFLAAFEVPTEGNGFNPEDVEGSTAHLMVTQEIEPKKDENGNIIPDQEPIVRNRVRYPRLSE